MKPETILTGIHSLQQASLYRTPREVGDISEFWFQKFKNMPDIQFLSAVNGIIENETTWPAISTIYKYASIWKDENENAKNRCPYCEDDGFILIKSEGKDIAYACKCPVGGLRRENMKIASYESLGIPWPEIGKPARRSDKMTEENRLKLNELFLAIGQEEDPFALYPTDKPFV